MGRKRGGQRSPQLRFVSARNTVNAFDSSAARYGSILHRSLNGLTGCVNALSLDFQLYLANYLGQRNLRDNTPSNKCMCNNPRRVRNKAQ